MIGQPAAMAMCLDCRFGGLGFRRSLEALQEPNDRLAIDVGSDSYAPGDTGRVSLMAADGGFQGR